MHQDFPQNLNWVASLNYSKSLKQFSNELKVSNPISWNSWLWLVFSEKMSMKTIIFYSCAALDKGKTPGLNKILKFKVSTACRPTFETKEIVQEKFRSPFSPLWRQFQEGKCFKCLSHHLPVKVHFKKWSPSSTMLINFSVNLLWTLSSHHLVYFLSVRYVLFVCKRETYLVV